MAAQPERASPSDGGWAAQLERLARLINQRLSGSRAQGRGAEGRRARTDGGRLRVLAGPDDQPFRLILVAGLQPAMPPLRWGVAVVETADPAAAAVEALEAGEHARQPITTFTGDTLADTVLADLTPGFAALLAGLTDRQREVGRLLLVDGLRRSEVATALGISRPTVSVMVDRARLRELDRFTRALDALLLTGLRSVGSR
jgi:DNA-directed RNA polymerase specialized sigma24 family protein